MKPAASKELVRRLVDEVINPWDLDALDAVCSPRLARRLRRWFGDFHDAFPDWQQEIVQLVAEGDVVVARFRCHGTQTGRWLGTEATGRSMRVDEVYFFTLAEGVLDGAWGLEDIWSRLRQLIGEERTLEVARSEAS
jgi:hypothetical protein